MKDAGPHIDEPPELFAWGRHGGVPGEFKSFIQGADRAARMERGDVSLVQNHFAREGVVRVANDYLRQLRTKKRAKTIDKKTPLKVNHVTSSMIYMLHAYCAECKQPAPPALLWLTFEAMGLRERRPASELEELLGVPTKPDDMANFFEAAKREGEADAAGTELSVKLLAKELGVPRTSLERWRGSSYYQVHRAFAAGSTQADVASWDKALIERGMTLCPLAKPSEAEFGDDND